MINFRMRGGAISEIKGWVISEMTGMGNVRNKRVGYFRNLISEMKAPISKIKHVF